MASIRSSSQRNCLVLIYSTPNTLCYTLSFNVSVLLLRATWKTSETAAIFQNVRRTVNKLSFPNNRNSYGRRSSWRILVIGSECLTKDTAISQKCQQNVSKIAQRHEYRLPWAAITPFIIVSSFAWSTIFLFVIYHLQLSRDSLNRVDSKCLLQSKV